MVKQDMSDLLLMAFSTGYHYAKLSPGQSFNDEDFRPIVDQMLKTIKVDEPAPEPVTQPQPVVKPEPVREEAPVPRPKVSVPKPVSDMDATEAAWNWLNEQKNSTPPLKSLLPDDDDEFQDVDIFEKENPRPASASTIFQKEEPAPKPVKTLRPFGNNGVTETMPDDSDLDDDDTPDFELPDLSEYEPEAEKPEVIEEPKAGDFGLDDMSYTKQVSEMLMQNDNVLLNLANTFNVEFTDNVFVAVKQKPKNKFMAFILKLTRKSSGDISYIPMIYRIANGKIDNVTETLRKANAIPDTSHVQFTKSDLNELDRVMQSRELDDLIYQYGSDVFPDTSRTKYMNILRTAREAKEPGMHDVYSWFIKNF